MPIINNTLLAGASGQGGGYEIENSLRFNRSASAYMSKTFSSDGGDDYTVSFWTKRCMSHSVIDWILGVPGNGGYAWQVHDFYINDDGVVARDSLSLYRDPSAWYHVCIQNDASTGNTIYINNEVVPMDGTSNVTTVNGATTHYIGRFGSSATHYYDGYMADWVFLSDRVAAPTDFGEYNDDGVWVPLDPSGLDFSGTNSHWLNFADSADLGADASGNGFDFTTTNINADDQRGDTPTANHATWNPLFFRRTGSYKPTFADGNLYVAGQSSQVSHTGTTISSTGKHYAEFLVNNGSSTITGPGVVRSYWDGGLAESYASSYDGSYYADDGTRYYPGGSDSQTAPGANRVGIEVDFANNEVEYFIVTSGGTRTAQGAKLTSSDGIDFDGEGIFTATLHDSSSRNVTAYFEADDWWGTPNAGYEALSTANLPVPTVADGSKYFNTLTYTGDGTTSRTITGVGFQPDLVWIKCRSNAESHIWTDAVRGISAGRLKSDSNAAEESQSSTPTATLSGFDSDGFVGPSSTPGNINVSGRTYVAWNWLAGNSTATNEDGSTTSTVSVNTTAGFSVVTYTGTGTTATVGHGLGVTPAMFIVKRRDGTNSWAVFQDFYGTSVPANNGYLLLNSNAAWSGTSGNNYWNDTSPTSSVFTVKDAGDTNASGDSYVAYCFANVDGFSKIGTYTGNGSTDGPFVWCGFRPAVVFTKRMNSTGGVWLVLDSTRSEYNQTSAYLQPHLNSAEVSAGSTIHFDFLSNGFKLRCLPSGLNASGDIILFMAFAEHPFGGDSIAPVPAR